MRQPGPKVERPRTPQALNVRTPTVKESEFWKQRVTREEQAAGLHLPSTSPTTSPPGTTAPSPRTLPSPFAAAPSLGGAGPLSAPPHSYTLGPNRTSPPWHPWLEGAVTRYEQNALGPTLPRHGVSSIIQPPPSLMALPFGSHDKAVERAYTRYGHLTRDQRLRSPTRTAPGSPARPSTAAPASHSAPSTLHRPGPTGITGQPGASVAGNLGHVLTYSPSQPASPKPSSPRTAKSCMCVGFVPGYTASAPLCASVAGGGAAAAAGWGPASVTIPNADTLHGLSRTIKHMPSPPLKAQGAASRPITPARRRPSPERLVLTQRVHTVERELQRERQTTKALRAVLRAATYQSVNASAAAMHYTYPVKV